VFTIITGNDAHYLTIKGSVREGFHGDPCTAMVEVSVHNIAAPVRYEFRPFLCRGDKAWELITEAQLAERRASLGVEATDATIGRSVYVVEWSAEASVVNLACSQVIRQMQGLLALGIFDLPETK
jgi:hypothetical protein